ncbi:hypothetical protein [Vibrio sp. 99K-1]|uniref:hypothetical protein n=1 Tax=Vibrio sp. 99K-1 TaxID=2607603 RepID=UPI001493B0F2|nr:hypothetical protein [Vibrio sp. 99K-1]NOI85013.1 hypothetical protein [Vibrio sp. 99K-1]
MEHKNNSATRAFNLLSKARTHQENSVTVTVWKSVLTQSNEPMDSFEVIRLVNLLRSEIKNIERKLIKAGVPQNIYVAHFNSAYNATSIESMNATWSNFKKKITNELLLCLKFSEFIIEENEVDFDEQSIQQIINLIDELKTSLNESTVDAELVHFVSEQIKLLERGLHDVKIRGSKAIQKCYVDGLGEIVENADLIDENKEQPIVQLLHKAWGQVQGATEKAAQLNKSADTWAKLIDRGSEVMDHLARLT